MKTAVIFGVVHMSLGIVMKAFNAVYFRSYVDLFFEFLPQLVMLLAMFGFMDVLIIAKWLTDFSGREHEAPSIISAMIAMFLEGGAIPEGTAPVLGSAATQQKVCLVLVLLTLLAIPTMLLPKPIIVHWARQSKQQAELN